MRQLCRYAGSDTYDVVRSMGTKWRLAATPQVFLEYEAVLMRPRIRRLTGLGVTEVHGVLDYIALVAEQTVVHYYWRPNLVDESDNKFVECAVACNARFIVTGNKRDFAGTQLGSFGFELVGPRKFMRRIS